MHEWHCRVRAAAQETERKRRRAHTTASAPHRGAKRLHSSAPQNVEPAIEGAVTKRPRGQLSQELSETSCKSELWNSSTLSHIGPNTDGGIADALALRLLSARGQRCRPVLQSWGPPRARAPELPTSPVERAKPKVSVAAEIERILSAQNPEELLGIGADFCEDSICRAWKRLMLLLHPDKVFDLDATTREAGAEALHRVHYAKDELSRRCQEHRAEAPEVPQAAGPPRCLAGTAGSRKYEVSWHIPEAQDPQRPVVKYEVWGPRLFSETGEPFDWVLLAALPPLQSHFVIVEEAPTQQDVMWAADRSRRATLPLTVHAANGKGSSEALVFELPWANTFPWLRGMASVLCPQCRRLQPQPLRDSWTQCSDCGSTSHCSSVILRCPECQGEVLWGQNGVLSCSCCMHRVLEAKTEIKPERESWDQGQWRSMSKPTGSVFHRGAGTSAPWRGRWGGGARSSGGGRCW